MTVYDTEGRAHPDVGTGAPSAWSRPTNKYVGCTCPAWRYSPRYPAPVSTDCPEHGGTQ